MRVGTHSLASSIVFSVIFIVSIDSINVIKTLRTEATCNGGGGWHALREWLAPHVLTRLLVVTPLAGGFAEWLPRR